MMVGDGESMVIIRPPEALPVHITNAAMQVAKQVHLHEGDREEPFVTPFLNTVLHST
jgi:hypothetical protein